MQENTKPPDRFHKLLRVVCVYVCARMGKIREVRFTKGIQQVVSHAHNLSLCVSANVFGLTQKPLCYTAQANEKLTLVDF